MAKESYISQINNTKIFAERAEYTKGGKNIDNMVEKVASATSGNLAAFDANGGLVDSNQAAANLVHDASYVHTDNNYTTTEKNKLSGIASNAQVNVIETVKVNGTVQTVTSKAVDITVPVAGTSNPAMDGTASAGSATTWSKSDHVHPTDTSREATANKDSSIPTSPVSGHYPSTEAVVQFVNSSVSTNTANFLGTYDVVTDLGLTTSATNAQIASALNSYTFPAGTTVTNNDYVFVSINYSTTTDVDEYRRFKYSDASNGSWAYEYTLNNSSFTQAQWDAINSAVTSTKVGNYDTHIANTNNPHGVTKAQVGLGNVGNFLAVSTDANQGLTDTQKVNARANIGAGTYSKPTNGIPSTDMESSVQTSLGKADTAYQKPSGGIPDSDIASASTWNGKQNALPTTGTASTTYAINVSGKAATAGTADSANSVAWSNVSGKPTVDQTYNATSTNPQSGTAVAQAVAKTVKKADASIIADGLSGERWYKVAESSFKDTYGNRTAAIEINYTDSEYTNVAPRKSNVSTMLVDLNMRSQGANEPYAVLVTAICSKIVAGLDVCVVSRGAVAQRKIELWVKCGGSEHRSSALISQRAFGTYILSDTSSFTFTSYNGVVGQAKPVTDSANNVYVYSPEIVSFDSTKDASWITTGTFQAAQIPTITPSMVESGSYYPISTTGLNAYIAFNSSGYDLIDMVIAKVTKGGSTSNSMITLLAVQGDNYGGEENQGIYIIQASYRGRAALTVTKVRAGSGFAGIYYYTDDTYMYVVYRRTHYSGCVTVRLLGRPAGAEQVIGITAPSDVTLTEATYRELAVADGVYPSMTAGGALTAENATVWSPAYIRGKLFDLAWEGTSTDLIVSARVSFVYGSGYPDQSETFDILVRFTGTTASITRTDMRVRSLFKCGSTCEFGCRLNDGKLEVWVSHVQTATANYITGSRVVLEFVSHNDFVTVGRTFVPSQTWPTMLKEVKDYEVVAYVKNGNLPAGSTSIPVYVDTDGSMKPCSSELPSGYGTSGQYLKSNGANSAPSWDDTSNINAGSVNGYSIDVRIGGTPGSDPNTIYFC